MKQKNRNISNNNFVLQRTALGYNQKYGFNVLPLCGKKPKINWEQWQNNRQLPDDIKKMNWSSNITGVGALSGINNLRVLDFDKIKDWEKVKTFIADLDLPQNYDWLVNSGSGEGHHIWITSTGDDKLFELLGSEKSNYKFNLVGDFADHLELRWKDCQTALPPSIHPSSNRYEFVNREPTEKPIEISTDNLIEVLKKYTKESEIETKSKVAVKRITDFIDKKKIESAITFLGKNLPNNCYDEWIRIGFALASLGEVGRGYFIKLSLLNEHYDDTEADLDKKFDSLLCNPSKPTGPKLL